MKWFYSVLLVSLVSVLLSGCATTHPTALIHNESLVVDDLGSRVSLADVQFDYDRMPVSRDTYFTPQRSGDKIAVMALQVLEVVPGRNYEFSPVTIVSCAGDLYPSLVRYYSGGTSLASDWGYQQRELFTGKLAVSFKRAGVYSVLLAFVYPSGTTFTSLKFFGNEFPLTIAADGAKDHIDFF
jgi:hypothetical protein